MMPSRIQRRRTKGWTKPEGAVYVGRGSKWGNPYKVGETYAWTPGCDVRPEPMMPGWNYSGVRLEKVRDAETAVDWFRSWVMTPNREALPASLAIAHWEIRTGLPELRGADLMCWCSEDSPCHADVLLEIANGGAS